MQKKSALRTIPVLFAAVCTLALAATCALAFPATALAEETVVAHTVDSLGNTHTYTNVNDAKKAGYEGYIVYMDADWDLGSASLDIADSKSLTIYMRGHRITSSNKDATIYVNEHASVKIVSREEAKDFSFSGFAQKDSSWEWQDLTISTSGLITNTNRETRTTAYAKTEYSSCGIHLEGSASLNLENVAVVGCADRGIDAGSKCSLTLTNTKVCYNRTPSSGDMSNGAGVSIKAGSTLTMNASHIDNNYAREALGGGIYAEKSTTIALENGSTVSNNLSGSGGGVCFSGTYFTLKSDDKSGAVSGNTAWSSSEAGTDNGQSGGGIHVCSANGENESVIDGITIKDNFSRYDGGGIELDQRWTTVRNCTITGNHSDYDGGGVYVNGGNNIFENCAITDNYCNGIGKNQEGGGVFVSCHYDIKMSGACVVKDNTRGKDTGNADDVFLSTLSGGGAKAYITGSLSEDASVGVRTGITGDRRVAKSFNPDTKDCLFADLSGYYISYGTDEGGDAWQRHATREFSVTLNGAQKGSYKNGTTVAINAEAADAGKFFWHWDREGTQGLKPVETYIPDGALCTSALTFTMPQNDVALAAVYGDKVASGQLELASPVAGQELPTTATFKRTDDGTGGQEDVTVNVSWYKVSGSSQEEAVSGKAEYGATYVARAWVDADQEAGRVFGSSVSVKVKSGSGEESAAKAEVRTDGSLYVQTAAFETEKPTVTKVYPATVTVDEGASEADLRAKFPSEASAATNAGTTVMLKVDTAGGDLSGLVKDGKVVKPEAGSATVSLPVSSSEVTVPSGLGTVAVNVAVTEKVQPETPAVSPAAGTYSTSEQPEAFDDGKLKLAVSCGTPDADIWCHLSWRDGDDWEDGGDDQKCADGTVYLPKSDGAQRLYRVEVWSEKDRLESVHALLSYTVDDVQAKTVTVRYADTAIDGQHGTKADDTHEAAQGSPLFIVAPEREGYVFEKWLGSDGTLLGTSSVLAIDSVEESMTVTAVYNPVVSEFNVGFGAPVAHEALAASGTVQAKAGDSDKYFDIESYFVGEGGKAEISWSPEGDADGKAEHMRSYTAAMTLDSSKAPAGVKYVISPNIKIAYAGNVIEDGSAYIAQDAEGAKRLCVAFPSTGPLEEPAFGQDLGTVELTYGQAWSYQAGQDAGKDESWGLPKEVEATCKCRCTVPLDITWEAVEGFDKGNYGEQEFTVKGKVTFPSYVDPDDGKGDPVSADVTATVKVAAAEQVAQPIASVEPGRHAGTQQVELFCETEGATIRYTVDGTEPTAESPAYDGKAIEIAHSATVKAKAFRDGWKPSDTAEFAYAITHQVSFDSAGGSAVEAQTVDDGACAIEPKAPAMDGWTFLGWYLEGGERYSFDSAVTADVTLYAHWAKSGEPVQAFTVVFDTAGGSAVAAQTVPQGECAQRPASDPTKDGYSFAGWYADKELTKEFDFSAPITESTTVYAKWTEAQGGGSGQSDDQGGSGQGQATGSADGSVDGAADDSAVPATSDAIPVFAVAAVVVVAIAAVVVAIVALRRRKN